MTDYLFSARLSPASGLYLRRNALPRRGTWALQMAVFDTLRLDVDRTYPQMRASGLCFPRGALSLTPPVHWVSSTLTEVQSGVWEGPIATRFPKVVFASDSALPHAQVRIAVTGRGGLSVVGQQATITFTGGAPPLSTTLDFESPYFHTAEFEFDYQYCVQTVTAVDTGAHPERPASVPAETLTVVDVYRRAGVDLRLSSDSGELPEEPFDTVWSDWELHDAMRTYWSRYVTQAPWAGWVLFAQHYPDPDVMGVMFDNGDLGPGNRIQRQGAAVFVRNLGEANPPGPPLRDAHLRRRTFFTLVHEMGHCFNLGHSWQKTGAQPWIPMTSDADALSFMNAPESVEGFWANFAYRFDNGELDFIRHAPPEFVEMGGTAAGENHGDRLRRAPEAWRLDDHLTLELAVARDRGLFDFLEPVLLEVTLTNTSPRPVFVDGAMLAGNDALTLDVVRPNGLAVTWRPHVIRCTVAAPRLLMPRESMAVSVFASAGVGGWHLAEPGAYTLHARLETLQGTAVATPARVRVATPRSREEEYLAQDYFSDEVGRALALGGTQVMTRAIEALSEVAGRLRGSAAARHAALALALPRMRPSRRLSLPEGRAPMASVARDGGKFVAVQPDPRTARRLLQEALGDDDGLANQVFGRRLLERYRRMVHDWEQELGGDLSLARGQGSPRAAALPRPDGRGGATGTAATPRGGPGRAARPRSKRR